MASSGPDGKPDPTGGETVPAPGPTRLELTIGALAFGGSGVGRTPEGLVVLVDRAVPGDRVRVEVTHRYRRFVRARIREILDPAAARRSPDCPHFDSCGGCAYQAMAYETEVAAKREQVFDLLKRVAGIPDPPVAATWPSPLDLGYRNRMTFTLPMAAGKGAGLHRQDDPSRVLEVPDCRLPSTAIQRAYRNLLPETRELPLHLRIRRLELRDSGEGNPPVLQFHAEGSPDGQIRRRALRWVEAGHVRGVTWIPDRRGRTGKPIPLAGEDGTVASLGGLEFQLPPGSFFQANAPMAARVFDEIARRCPSGGAILELYAGVGALTVYLARRGSPVLAVEGNPSSVKAARENLRRLGIEGAAVLARPVEVAVESLHREARTFSTLVLDPPRTGLPRGVAERLIPLARDRILYLSCDPATLARDLAILIRGGRWRLKEALPIDFFPRTAGVECLVELESGAIR